MEFENCIITIDILKSLGFKNIIHNWYDYRTNIDHIRYNFDNNELIINSIKQPNKIFTLLELKIILNYNNINIELL